MPREENLTPFQKGKSGNPAGRPKGTLNAKTVIQKWLKVKEKIKHPITGDMVQLTQLDIIALAQLKKAREGEVQSFNAILDRFEGKPTQKQEIDFPVDQNTEFTIQITKRSTGSDAQD